MTHAQHIQAIAKDAVDKPLNEWPDHTKAHESTLMGAFLFDYCCIRCWLERYKGEKLENKDNVGTPG